MLGAYITGLGDVGTGGLEGDTTAAKDCIPKSENVGDLGEPKDHALDADGDVGEEGTTNLVRLASGEKGAFVEVEAEAEGPTTTTPLFPLVLFPLVLTFSFLGPKVGESGVVPNEPRR